MKKIFHILDGIIFDSSWELAYYIYLRDFGIPFEYHPNIEIPYKIDEDDTKFKIYHPDFKVYDKLVEIKGTIDEFTDRIWQSLNEDNKVSLFVRFIDLATGRFEERILNKNK